MENLTIIGYTIYLPIVILMTVLVAHSLFKNSRVFMLDIFNQREEIALSTNQLFKTGFYLLNIGMAFLIIEMYNVETTQSLFEKLSAKIGGFSIYLGVMLFINLFFFFRGKRKAAQQRRETQELSEMRTKVRMRPQ
ncbi:MAG: hypothetical protein GY827_01730 [Cytophagales bacterium]|nr:hypothetical protein [Cytophagales bacterium]